MNALIRIVLIVLVATIAAGCAITVQEDTRKDLDIVRQGPESLPARNVTDFSEGLRCMDNLFLVFGVGGLDVLVEKLEDNTEQVKAGTRDMLITAISDMTKRSQAVQVVTYGADTGNLISFLESADQESVYDRVPAFDIRGSISQLDKDIVRHSKSVGLNVGGTVDGNPFGGEFGKAAVASGTILGLDLSMITTMNMAVIPGVTSRNSVVIFKADRATDAEGGLVRKFGVNFRVSALRNEGTTQALRALIELAAMELFGKLVKVPYWTCLGLDPEQEQIAREVEDWFHSMSRNDNLVSYLQTQLHIRGYYHGPIDGILNSEFGRAVSQYKHRLGLPADHGLDVEFFRAFLNTIPSGVESTRLAYQRPVWVLPSQAKQVGRRQQTAAGADGPKENAPVPDNEPDLPAETASETPVQSLEPVSPMRVSIQTDKPEARYQPGENVELTIRTSVNGFLYCFYRDAEETIVRFFPNRFSPDGFISARGQIQLPGDMPFSINANSTGQEESAFCYVAGEDIMALLPHEVRRADFEPLGYSHRQQVSAAFVRATRGRVGEAAVIIHAQ